MNRVATTLMALLVLLVIATLSLFVGVIDLQPKNLFNPEELELLLVSRLPRTLAVLITGSALAVCGTIIQLLVRNRFVEPMTAGTGQGAMLGILIAILYFPSASLIVQICIAATMALISSIGLMLIVIKLPATKPLYIALVGLIYGGIIGAGVTFVAYQADLLQYIEIWTTGEFSGVLQGRYETLWIAAIVALLAYLIADQFAIVGMGRTTAISLGLNYNQVVVLGLITISIVTALTVVTVGMIPFVGLVIPNIVSRLYGDNARLTLPITAFFGASLVLICDIIGRVVRYPFEIPVGTIMGIIDALIFLWILYGRERHAR
ncbi:iron complex transport system permease protein [Maritalea mobilis]|uniref:Iron complex transport system permease protein n=1 Tax=Maritalea mobilis TaxID=483324 RepID=A0A4V3DBN8_9HYPH|nr:iron chelate uptake ABC transporter family permease subunit [Maritalea mobilis]TDQ67298.1 iron complex transport system permease protein [Maritalea mobilis]